MKKIVIVFVVLFFGASPMFSQITDTSKMIGASDAKYFSPNGDGVNDIFVFTSQNITKQTTEIFDKEGNIVFKSESLRVEWDGKNLNGMLLKDGIYTYKLTALGADEKVYSQSGKIALKR